VSRLTIKVWIWCFEWEGRKIIVIGQKCGERIAQAEEIAMSN